MYVKQLLCAELYSILFQIFVRKNAYFVYILKITFCDILKMTFCDILKMTFCDILKMTFCDILKMTLLEEN